MARSAKSQSREIDAQFGDVPGEVNIAGHDVIKHETHIHQAREGHEFKGQINTAEPPPDNFVERPEVLDDLRRHVLNRDANRHIALTALRGMGGIGKTVLAQALCQDEQVKQAFPDGIVWVDIGQQPGNIAEKVKYVGGLFEGAPSYYESAEAGAARLRAILADKAVLIVLDDVWDGDIVKYFRINSPRCCVLFTTRRATSTGATEIQLGLPSPEEALAMLRKYAGHDDPEMPEIVQRLGRLPLGVKIAGLRISRNQPKMSSKEWLTQYREHVAELKLDSEKPTESLRACFELSVQSLQEAYLYHALGIFPEHLWIRVDVVKRLWGRLNERMGDFECGELVNTLDDLGLITLNDNRDAITMHDLLHEYNVYKLKGKDKESNLLTVTHEALLTAYNPDRRPWYEVQHDGYLYYQLSHHMTGAGRKDELFRLLTTAPDWMSGRQRSVTLERMLETIWERYWKEDQDQAKKFLSSWLSHSRDRSTVYTSKSVAVQCAFLVQYDDLLVKALCHSDERVRAAGMAHTYYRYRQEPDSGLRILEALSRHTTRLGLPYPTVIRSLLETSVVILSNEYQKPEPDEKSTQAIGMIAGRAIRDALLINSALPSVITTWVRHSLVDFVMNYIQGQLKQGTSRSAESDAPVNTVQNLREYELFFETIENRDLAAREVYRYLDRGYGDLLSEVSLDTLVSCFDGTLVYMCVEFGLVVHGVEQPDRALDVINELYDYTMTRPIDDVTFHIRLDMIATWRRILMHQPKITEAWLRAAHRLTDSFYAQYPPNATEYGLLRTRLGKYEYFAMTWYAQIWNRVYPDRPVDLVDKYLHIAEGNKNRDLQIHILKGFADPRASFIGFKGILEHFKPYLLSGDEEIRRIVIRTLGHLRSRAPDTFDEFLSRAELRDQQIIDQILETSFQESSYQLILNVSEFVTTMLARGSTHSLDWLFNNLDEIFDQGSFIGGLRVVVKSLLATLEKPAQDATG